MKEALPIAKSFAFNPKTEKHVRIIALRILKEHGNQEDLDSILNVFISEEDAHDREFFAELINSLNASNEVVEKILKGLNVVQGRMRYSYDQLGYALANLIERSDSEIAAKLVMGIDDFIRREPVLDRRHCEISQQYNWLLPVSKKAIEKLILSRNSAVFNIEVLFALTQIPIFKDYNEFEDFSSTYNMQDLVADWKELNHVLFWKAVEEIRKNLGETGYKSLNQFWQVSFSGGYWSFNKKDFDLVVADISDRELLDDRLIALSLAFQLYKDNERPKKWLEMLKKAVADESDLKDRLHNLLHPPVQPEEVKKWKQEVAQSKYRNKEKEKKLQKEHEQNVKWLNKNYQQLRFNGLKEGSISSAQYYLHERMRNANGKDASGWTKGNWRSLIKDYGVTVAEAFRDGLLSFWRTYKPELRSEKDENNIPFSIIFGLSGLEVESAETMRWPQDLSREDSELACRYAFHELNGFPNWLPRVYEKFPHIVEALVLNEVDWELRAENSNEAKHYILNRISWDCEWLWDSLAVKLLDKLQVEPINAENLKYLSKILQRSSVISDEQLSELARKKCDTVISSENISYWYATWIGVEPSPAITSFSSHLAALHIQDREKAKILAMRVIVNLMGERRSGSNVRGAFKSPQHLKNLYLLMHQYIRIEEDINRANQGAYSPELRDDAQEARDALFTILKNIPGKEAYLAIVELAKEHPVESYRVWMMRNAKERAELDADISPWTAEKFGDFAKALESTPANHRELFDLGVQRLLDLKHELEESDESIASTLVKEDQETGIRKVIANWCRSRAAGRYTIAQEEELADEKRPDCRFLSSSFDAPVPLELKLADNWSGPKLFERLENQLCGDYLRDKQSNRGIFVLVYRGKTKNWQIPGGNVKATFSELTVALQSHWENISHKYPKVEQITVIGIDLTRRMNRVKMRKS